MKTSRSVALSLCSFLFLSGCNSNDSKEKDATVGLDVAISDIATDKQSTSDDAIDLQKTPWSTNTSPVTEALVSVWGSAENNVYAVGGKGIILHYDGTNWIKEKSNTALSLSSIWGTGKSDIYAAGDKGIVVHYDGVQWQETQTPAIEKLNDIHGADGIVYAVGEKSTVVRFDGANWTVVNGTFQGSFQSVWVSSLKEVWVAGFTTDSDSVLVKYDGTSWVTSAIDSHPIHSIWKNSAGTMFAVGGWLAGGKIYEFDGMKWSQTLKLTTGWLSGIWGSGSDIIAVGNQGEILQSQGNGWSEMKSGTTNTLFDIWGGNSTFFAVGDGGTILTHSRTK